MVVSVNVRRRVPNWTSCPHGNELPHGGGFLAQGLCSRPYAVSKFLVERNVFLHINMSFGTMAHRGRCLVEVTWLRASMEERSMPSTTQLAWQTSE